MSTFCLFESSQQDGINRHLSAGPSLLVLNWTEMHSAGWWWWRCWWWDPSIPENSVLLSKVNNDVHGSLRRLNRVSLQIATKWLFPSHFHSRVGLKMTLIHRLETVSENCSHSLYKAGLKISQFPPPAISNPVIKIYDLLCKGMWWRENKYFACIFAGKQARNLTFLDWKSVIFLSPLCGVGILHNNHASMTTEEWKKDKKVEPFADKKDCLFLQKENNRR